MTSGPPRYRDYLGDIGDTADGVEVVAEPDTHASPRPHQDPRVLINLNRYYGTWSAIYETNEGLVAEIDNATRDDAIKWAHAHCPNVLIFDPAQGDFVSLDPPS